MASADGSEHTTWNSVDPSETASTTFAVADPALRTRLSSSAPPAKMTGVNVSARGFHSMQIGWTQPTDFGGSNFKKYIIEWSSDNTNWSVVTELDNRFVLFYDHISDLITPGSTFYYRMKVVNANDEESPVSDVTSATAVAFSDVGVPTGVTATKQSGTSIQVSWTAPTNLPAGRTIQQSLVYRTENDGDLWEDQKNASSPATTYTGLEANTCYGFRVQVQDNLYTYYHLSDPVYATTGTVTAPAAPTGLTATGTGTTFNLSWTAPASDKCSAITGYQIQQRANSSDTWSDVAADTGDDAVTYDHTGQTIATSRQYQVRAKNSAGFGAWSDVFTTMAAATMPPDAPTGLANTTANQRYHRVDLEWNAYPDASLNGGTFQKYIIEFSEDFGNWSVAGEVTSQAQTSFNHFSDLLTPGKDFYYRVRAVNTNDQQSAPSNRITVTALARSGPGIPTGVTATRVSGTSIKVDWTAPTDVDVVSFYFPLVTTDNGDSWTTIGNLVTGNLTTATYTGLEEDTCYGFRLYAFYQLGTEFANGHLSDAAYVTTAASLDKPGAPTDLAINSDGTNTFNLSWSPPADKCAAVTGYTIQESPTGADGSWKAVAGNTGSADTEYAHTNQTLSEVRWYRVAARNSAGRGAWSEPASTAPSAPTGLTVGDTRYHTVILQWDFPARSTLGSSAYQKYIIEWSTDNRTWSQVAEHVDDEFAGYLHTSSLLTPGEDFYYRVKVVNTDGQVSPPSAPVTATAVARSGLRIPTGVTATRQSNTSVRVAWTAATDFPGGETPHRYFVYRTDNDGDLWSSAGFTSNAMLDVTDLEATTCYGFRVSHQTSGFVNSHLSDAAYASTGTVAAPGAPTAPSATSDGTSTITLSWTAPTVSDKCSAITGYQIQQRVTGGDWEDVTPNTGSDATTYAHTSQTLTTVRQYQVRAINAGGTTGAWSTAVTAGMNVRPGAPQNLAAIASGTTTIDLTWAAPASDGGSAITSYRVQVSTDGGSNYNDVSPAHSGTTRIYSATGLTAGTQYYYRVYATNSVGEGSASTSASATTRTAPSVPQNLRTLSAQYHTVTLTWDPVTGSSLGTDQTLKHYVVEFSTDNSTWSTFSESDNTTAVHTTDLLVPGEQFYYRVRTVNSNDDASANSDVLTVTAVARSGWGTPTAVTATKATNDSIDVAWTAPTDLPSGRFLNTYFVLQTTNDGVRWMNATNGFTFTADPQNTPPATMVGIGGLDADTCYGFRVYSTSNGDPENNILSNTSALSDPAYATTGTITSAPGVPTGLTATASGPTAINLAWTAPSGSNRCNISGYEIEWSADGNDPWTDVIANTMSTATTYTDAGLSAATTRHYRVKAINSAGTGSASTSDDATTGAAVRPTAPQNLVATPSGRTVINLTWDLPSSTGGSAITGYRVQVSTDGGTNYNDVSPAHSGTTRTYSDTGLDPNTTRHYRVYASTTAGESAQPSNTDDATTAMRMNPGAPTGVTVTASGRTILLVSWTAPADDGGRAITGYKIEVSTDGTSYIEEVANTMSTATSYVDRGLSAGSTRHYRVSAISSQGTGSASTAGMGTTVASSVMAVPSDPTGLAATPSGRTLIQLSWTAPSDNGGSSVTGYQIEWSSDGISNWADVEDDTESTTTTYIDRGLSAGSTRHYRVSAINTTGTGTYSTSAMATTVDGSTNTIPSDPTMLTAAADGPTEIDLSWTAPADNGGSAITGYRVLVSTDGGTNYNDVSPAHSGTTRTYSDTGLLGGVTRYYQVRAINAQGQSLVSNIASATTDAATVPGNPTSLAVAADGPMAMGLTWSAPTNNGGAVVSGYRVEFSETALTGPWTLLVMSQTATTYTHTGRSASTTYYYRVQAINSVGNSTGATASGQTAAPTRPGAPTSPGATPDGPTRMDLSWTAPTNTGGVDITGYRIEVGGAGNWEELAASHPSTSYTHTGLTAVTRYDYQVFAINSVGRGPASAAFNASTPVAVVPTVPTSLAATASGPTIVNLSWSAPENNGGATITGYRVEGSTSSSGPWTLLAMSQTGLTYSHTGRRAATVYYYQVRALNSAGMGAVGTVNATTGAATVPGAPASIQVQAYGRTVLGITWQAPTNTGGIDVSGYDIEWSPTGTGNWNMLSAEGAMAVHTGLVANFRGYYRVRARNTVGPGPWAMQNGRTANNVNPAVTSPPRSLTATASGRTLIELSWDAPSNTGGAPVTGYRIEVSSDAGATWMNLAANTGSTVTRYRHRGLTAGAARRYRVRAINRQGNSWPSNTAMATTASGTSVPSDPTGLTATVMGQTAITVSWTVPSDNGGANITGYRVEWSADGSTGWTNVDPAHTGTTASYSDTGLPSSVTRHYRVRAINGQGESLPSNVASATTGATSSVPGAPTGLQAAPMGQTQIDLSWTAPSNTGGSAITSYRIQVSTDGGTSFTDLVASTGNANTKYSHTGLALGTTRHYRVYASNTNGESANPSNTATATTQGVVAPGAPTGLSVAASGRTILLLSWTAPSSNGGEAVNGYQIEWSADGTSNWQDVIANTMSTLTTYLDRGLSAATMRHYRVRARNSQGAGDPSTVMMGTTVDGTTLTVPSDPTSVTATPSGRTLIQLSWAAPANDGGSAVTGYQIEGSADGSTGWTNVIANTMSTTYRDRGLSAGTTRHYRVRAINDQNTGSPSTIAMATTVDGSSDAVPSDPTGLMASVNGQALVLAWEAPANSGSASVTGYRIEWSADGSDPWTSVMPAHSGTDRTYTDRSVAPSTTRHYRVYAINTIGESLASAPAMATSGAATVPGAPTGLTATADGQTIINLRWTAPTNTGGRDITEYRVEWSANGTDGWTNVSPAHRGTTTMYAHTGLPRGTTRHYRVRAINREGNGAWSSIAMATTVTVPGPPRNLTATARGLAAIELTWAAPTSNGGSAITGYSIQVSSDGSAWAELVATQTQTTYTHTGLSPSATRHYRVHAINTAGSGAWSNVARATTTARTQTATRPGAPQNLTATASPGAITLTWAAPTSNGGSAITGYRVEGSADGTAPWTELVATQTQTTYMDQGLEAGVTRHYRVQAINRVGAGPWTAVRRATTPGATPGEVTRLMAQPYGRTLIELTWTPPTGTEDITGYQIEVAEEDAETQSAKTQSAKTQGAETQRAETQSAETQSTETQGAETQSTETQSAETELTWRILVENTNSKEPRYVHRNLNPGVTLHYRVRAVGADGATSMAPSNEDMATTVDARTLSIPSDPLDLVATVTPSGTTQLAWSAPADDGGQEITGYKIEFFAEGTWQTLMDRHPATRYTDPNLLTSTRSYRVRALNAQGESLPASVQVSPPDPTARFAQTAAQVLESAGTYAVRVHVSAPRPAAFTLPYTIAGTATLREDYTITNAGVLEVPANATSADILVVLHEDDHQEPEETVILTLDGQVFTLTILDDSGLSLAGVVPDQSYQLGQAIAPMTFPVGQRGTPPYSYALAPALPPGLLFDVATRILSGTPTEAFPKTSFTYTVTDADAMAAAQTFTIEVAVPEALRFAAPVGAHLYPVRVPLKGPMLPGAEGGIAPYSYALTPTLPPGMAFDIATRTLTGTPTEVTAEKTYTYVATDQAGTRIQAEFQLGVYQMSFVEQVPDQSYTRDEPIADLVLPEAMGGALPVTYTLTLLELPLGLEFDLEARTIRGTPTDLSPPVALTYRATDAKDAQDSLRFTIEVVSPVSAEEAEMPQEFQVYPNYPNPFQHATHLVLDLPWPAQVQVEVLDVTGRRVMAPPPMELGAGRKQEIPLRELRIPSGVYLYRIQATTPEQTYLYTGYFMRVR